MVELTTEERTELEHLVRAHTRGQQVALRAQIILAACRREPIMWHMALGVGLCRVERAALMLFPGIKASETRSIPFSPTGC